jgi:hypothetical protein
MMKGVKPEPHQLVATRSEVALSLPVRMFGRDIRYSLFSVTSFESYFYN